MHKISPLIRQAIDMLGSQERLASTIGCSQQRISQLLRADRVSAEMALAIDLATQGRVPCSALRPDIWPQNAQAPGQDQPAIMVNSLSLQASSRTFEVPNET